MLRRDLFGALAGGAVALGSGCGAGPTAELKRLRVSTSEFVMNSGFYVAQERGYFTRAALEIEAMAGDNASQLIPVMAAGGLDVMLSILSPAMLNAVRAGVPVRMVATRGVAPKECPESVALYWRKGEFPAGVEGARMLRGKKVAAGRQAGFSEFLMDTTLEAAGVRPGEFDPVYLSEPEAVAALVKGSVDAIVGGGIFDRNLLEVAPQLMVGLALADLLPDYQISFVLFGKRLLESPVEVGARFLSAYLRGAREFREGATPEFLRKRALEAGLEAGQGHNVCRTTVSADGAIRPGDLQRYIDWTVRKGYCEDPPAPDRLVDHRFLEHADKGADG